MTAVAVDAALADSLAKQQRATRLWVAFSGGADSTALLLALQRWSKSDGRPLHAVHVNHAMQAQAAAWEAHCAVVAQSLRVPLTVLRVRVAATGSREAAARDARYAALAHLMAAGDLLLLAHHQDDQVETVLMRALRGSSVLGMPPTRSLGAGALLRPFLDVSRAALVAYVAAAGVPYVTDPSNADARFTRGQLRTALLPLIQTHWPAAGARLLALAAREAQRDRALAELLAPQLDAAIDAAGGLDIGMLKAASPAIAAALLAAWLTRRQVPALPVRHHAELLRQLREARPDRQLMVQVHGGKVRCHRGRVMLLAEPPLVPNHASDRADADAVSAASGTVRWDGQAPLQTTVGELQLLAAPRALRWPAAGVEVRLRAGGERLVLTANGQRRSVKALLRERGIAPWLRAGWPLLYAADALICVPEVAIAFGWQTQGDEPGVCVRLQPPARRGLV